MSFLGIIEKQRNLQYQVTTVYDDGLLIVATKTKTFCKIKFAVQY